MSKYRDVNTRSLTVIFIEKHDIYSTFNDVFQLPFHSLQKSAIWIYQGLLMYFSPGKLPDGWYSSENTTHIWGRMREECVTPSKYQQAPAGRFSQRVLLRRLVPLSSLCQKLFTYSTITPSQCGATAERRTRNREVLVRNSHEPTGFFSRQGN